MTGFFDLCLRRRWLSSVPVWLVMLLGFAVPHSQSRGQAAGIPIIDRTPFDRIILNSANKNAEIEVVLLDLPKRRLPNPLPQSGTLEVKRLSQPSTIYEVMWSTIERVELYEQMVLAEAIELSQKNDTLAAFRSFSFLHQHYPNLPGLDEASERYVYREALNAFSNNSYSEGLAILLTLYDLNSEYQGLESAVGSVSDKLISKHLKERDFAAARGVLDMLKQSFPSLQLSNVAVWEGRFEKGAARQLSLGREAIASQEYEKARLAIGRALDILPGVAGAQQILEELNRLSPRTVVGVSQLVPNPENANTLVWPQARIKQLIDPNLIQMVGFGTEGGIYQSQWATLEPDDAGLRLDIALSPAALAIGFTPEQIALEILALSSPASSRYAIDFADAFDHVTIEQGYRVGVHWRRPHVRPEALLRLPLEGATAGDLRAGIYRATPSANPEQVDEIIYESVGASPGDDQAPRIIERVFDTEEQALASLRSGEIDAIDQLAPWDADQLKSSRNVVVDTYRLPTVHVLRLNFENPLLKSREFRRALAYGIDRERIISDVLLGGKNRPGFRILSGPLPAGTSFTDPVGYAYNQQLLARPYEPRLSAVLATVAKNALAKKQAAASQKEAPEESNEGDSEEESNDESQEPEKPKMAPLRLVYPPDSLSRTCCQTIKLQLSALGVPIELVELPRTSSALPEDYDLAYTQLAFREPLVDARRLLGPQGLAGSCSSSMNLALQSVDRASNWKEARDRLYEVHQVAHNDLPVIPLWQTVDSFAYHKSLRGIEKDTVSLYQNLGQWQTSLTQGGR